jgi:hypothetical protein
MVHGTWYMVHGTTWYYMVHVSPHLPGEHLDKRHITAALLDQNCPYRFLQHALKAFGEKAGKGNREELSARMRKLLQDRAAYVSKVRSASDSAKREHERGPAARSTTEGTDEGTEGTEGFGVRTERSVLDCTHIDHAQAAKHLDKWCNAEFQKHGDRNVTLGTCTGVTHMEDGGLPGDHSTNKHHLI